MAYATGFFNAYLKSAPWSSVDEHENPLDETNGPEQCWPGLLADP